MYITTFAGIADVPDVPLVPDEPATPDVPEVPDVPDPLSPPLPVIGGSKVAFFMVILLPSHFIYDSVTGKVTQSESTPPYPI